MFNYYIKFILINKKEDNLTFYILYSTFIYCILIFNIDLTLLEILQQVTINIH